MTIAVVTPWLNHRELEADYHHALELGPMPDEVIVVDNGSDPPLPWARIRLEANEGFSKASNIGLLAATSTVVFFLNDDIAATEHGWLRRLADAVEPKVLVGARLRQSPHADVDGKAYPYLDGWCMGGRRKDLNALGGFDESYQEPAYFSDNDLCLRARAAGMTLREVRVGLKHKRGVTAGDVTDPSVRDATRNNYARYAELARRLSAEKVAA